MGEHSLGNELYGYIQCLLSAVQSERSNSTPERHPAINCKNEITNKAWSETYLYESRGRCCKQFELRFEIDVSGATLILILSLYQLGFCTLSRYYTSLPFYLFVFEAPECWFQILGGMISASFKKNRRSQRPQKVTSNKN